MHVTHQLGAVLRRRALDRKPWLATLRFDPIASGSGDIAPGAKRLARVSPPRP
ncbi:MAG: hypothetical protein H0T39_03100 [Actinobacteria bacterium]|nr:hypothetical protein [Actinomycetota bacterium]